MPDHPDFAMPTKDEFGGYSKHDFVENDDSSILKLLNFDLNKEVKKLVDDLDSKSVSFGSSSILKNAPSDNLVDTKKRDRKVEHKLNSASKSDEFSITPLNKPLNSLKNQRNIDSKVKAKRRLFEESAEKPVYGDENKPTPSSSNSKQKESKSKLHTSDIKCSEVLTPRKLNFDSSRSPLLNASKEPFRVLDFENTK